MPRFRLLLPLALAVLLALMPAATRAAGYKTYVSRVCPYAIRYPANWSYQQGTKHDTFVYESSPSQFAQILVSCAYGRYHRSVKNLTRAVASAYARQGYALGQPQYKGNELGLFFGQTSFKANHKTYMERLHVSTLIFSGHAWVFALAGDSSDFNAAEGIYAHVLASFTARSH